MRMGLAGVVVATMTAAAVALPLAPAAAAAPDDITRAACKAPSVRVSDLTYAELTSRYVLNNGEPIPTLEQFLSYADSAGVGVLPEIKNWDVPAYAGYDWAPPGTTGDVSSRTPTALQPQLEDYLAQLTSFPRIPTKLIGSFDPSVLQWFKDQPASSGWERIWFRSTGGTDLVQPGTPPFAQEITKASGAPLTAADFGAGPDAALYARTYEGTTGGAPAATSIGLLNVLWFRGSLHSVDPSVDLPYDVPASMAAANLPVYVWFNTITGGDTATGGSPFPIGIVTGNRYDSSVPTPGWEASAALGARWIATDDTAGYKAWAASTSQPVPAMVAHRGGGTPGVAENSMAAFRQAVADGAAILETDVQWTKPERGDEIGVAVLMHDETIARTMKCRPGSGGPTITATVKGKQNASGWYRSKPLVRFRCTKGKAPLARPCPSPVRVGQGRNKKVRGTVVDTKGRKDSVVVKGIDVDLTPPSVRVSVLPLEPGGPTGADRIACRVRDPLSGPAGCDVDATLVSGVTYRYTATGRDVAGNRRVVSGRIRVP